MGVRATRTRSDTVAAALAAAAALLHLVLLPEHFGESLLFGVVFVAIAAFQLSVAALILKRPTPTVRSIGRWGMLIIVTVFLGARVIAPPGQSIPETITPAGVLSLVLEISAVAALTVVVPMRQGRRRPDTVLVPALAAGMAFFLLDLLAAGSISFYATPIPRPSGMGLYANGVNTVSPAITALVAAHWSIYLPLLSTAASLVVAVLLTLAVGLTLRMVQARPRCSARLGLLGAVPASFAAPVCCGPSLLSAVGAGAAGALGWLATPLLLLSALFLGADILWLRRCLRATLSSPGSPRAGAGQDAA